MTAEHGLRSKFSPDDLDNFLRLSSELLVVVDNGGQLLQTNAAFEQSLGWQAADILGKSFVDLFSADSRSASQQAIVQALEAKTTVFQGCCHCSDGGRKWIEWTVSRGLAKLDSKLYCVGHPIDKPYRAADIRRYAEAIENMQDGFHLWHLDNPKDASSLRLKMANPAAEKLLETPNHQALEHCIYEVMPNLTGTPVPEICRQAVLNDQKKDLGNIDYRLSTGESCVFSVKIFPLEDRFLGVLFEDVTAAQRAQEQLTEQKERLRIIFEQAGVGIARLDVTGQWIQANDKLCEILAYSRKELFQKDFRDITHPEDAGQDTELYRALLQGKLETAAMEKRYLRKDGEAVWCSVTVSMIRDQQRQPLYFIAFIQDITDRKTNELALQNKKDELAMSTLILAQTTANLEQRNRELDEFAYVASHDLKAPLRAIANLATWLEEDLEGQLPPENKDQLDLLQGRVHRMENLIDGLLAYSRVGRGNYRLESIDLNQLVRNVVDLLAPPPKFTVAIAPNLPTLQASRPALTQVFNNLISNAIKHHDRPEGHVEICYRHLDNDFYEFSVIDDGPGIAPAFHKKVFSIFQVLKARDKVENTGIGLAIVKKTVEAEGGIITVESSGGRGTIFRFTWPQQP